LITTSVFHGEEFCSLLLLATCVHIPSALLQQQLVRQLPCRCSCSPTGWVPQHCTSWQSLLKNALCHWCAMDITSS